MTAMVLKRRLYENVYEHDFMDFNEKECLNVDPNTILKKRKKKRHKAHVASEVPVVHGMDSEVNIKNSNLPHGTIVTGNGEQSEMSDNLCNWRDEGNEKLCSQKDSLKLKQKKHKHKEREVKSGASRTVHEVPATANEADAGISHKENMNMYTHKESSYLKWKKHKHKEREVSTEHSRTSPKIPEEEEESGISNEEIKNMCLQTDSSHLNRKKYKHVESNATCLPQSQHEFTCPTCLKNFDDRIDFVNHLLLHREENLFSCTSRKKHHCKDHLASEAAVAHGKESKVHTRNDHLGNYKDEENKNIKQKKHKHKKSNLDTGNGMAPREISVPASVAEIESGSEEKSNPCGQIDSLYLKWKKQKHKHKASKVNIAKSTASQETPVISSTEQLESYNQENKNVYTKETSSHIKRKEQKNKESKHMTQEIPVIAGEQPESDDKENKNMCTEKDSLNLKQQKKKHKDRKVNTGDSMVPHEVPGTAIGEQEESGNEVNYYLNTQKDSLPMKQKKKKKKDRQVNTEESVVSHEILATRSEERPESNIEEDKNMCTEEDSLHSKQQKQKHKGGKVNTGDSMAPNEVPGTAVGGQEESGNEENYYLSMQKDGLLMKQKKKKKKEHKVNTEESIVSHEILVTTNEESNIEEDKNMGTKDSLYLKQQKLKHKGGKVNTGDSMAPNKVPGAAIGEQEESGNEENYYLNTQKDSLPMKQKKKKKHKVNTEESILSHEVLATTDEERQESNIKEDKNMGTKEDILYLKRQKHKDRKVNTGDSMEPRKVPGTVVGEQEESGTEENYYWSTQKDSLQVKQKKKKRKERKVNTEENIVSHEILVTTNEERSESNSEEDKNVGTEDSLHLKQQKQKHKDKKVKTGDSMASHKVLETANEEEEDRGNEENYYLSSQKDSLFVKPKKKNKKERQVNTKKSVVSHEILVTGSEERPESIIEKEKNIGTEEDSLHLKQQKKKHKDRKANTGDIMEPHEVPGTAIGEREETVNLENCYRSTQEDSMPAKHKKKKNKERQVNAEKSIVSHKILVTRNEERPESRIQVGKNMCREDNSLHLKHKHQKHRERIVNTGGSMALDRVPGTANGEGAKSGNEENYYLCTQKDSSLIKGEKKKKKVCQINTGESNVSHEQQPESCNEENQNMCTEEDSLNLKQKERGVNTTERIVSHETPVTLSVEEQDSCVEENKNVPTQKKRKHQESQVNTGDSMLSHEVPVATVLSEPDQSNEENKNLRAQDHILNPNLEKHKMCHGNSGNSRMSQEITASAHEGEPDRNNEENDNECTQTYIFNLNQEKNEECFVNSGSNKMSHEVLATVGKKEESESSYKGNQQNLSMKKDISDLKLIEHKHKESKAIYLARLLQESLRITQSEHEFTCPTCFKNFSNRSNFVRHLLIHRYVKDFSCAVCEKSFRTKRSLQLHMRTHTKEKPQEKQKHKEGDVTAGSRRMSHEILATAREEGPDKSNEQNENLSMQNHILNCNQEEQGHTECNVNAGGSRMSYEITWTALEGELDTSNEETENECTHIRILNRNQEKHGECHANSESLRTSHEMPVTLGKNEESERSNKNNKQNLCTRKVGSDPKLIEHKESKPIYLAKLLHKSLFITNSEHEFSCPICSKTFNNRSNFVRHLLIHRDVKDFSCYVCDKSFRTKQSLQVHMRTHMNEKPFKCTKCSACFSDANNLRRHVLVHNKGKQFVCAACSKAFAMKHHLEKHMLSHEGTKLFPCPHCSKVFNYEYRLRIHLNTCRKLNPITCSVCSKVFPRVYNLNRHMSTHE